MKPGDSFDTEPDRLVQTVQENSQCQRELNGEMEG